MQFDAPVNSTDGALVLFFTSRRNNTMRLLQYPARHSFIGERETLRAVFPVRLRIRNKKIAFGDLKEREGERKRHGINYPTSLPCLALPCLALPCPPYPSPSPPAPLASIIRRRLRVPARGRVAPTTSRSPAAKIDQTTLRAILGIGGN